MESNFSESPPLEADTDESPPTKQRAKSPKKSSRNNNIEVDTVEPTPQTMDIKSLDVMDSTPGSLSQLTSNLSPMTDQDWQQDVQEKLQWLLTEFPNRFNSLLGEYKKPITSLGIVLAAIPFVALSAALLQVINAIPFFAPTFELIGFGYTSWFIYRYLLFADRRQEFTRSLEEYKQQILGQRGSTGK